MTAPRVAPGTRLGPYEVIEQLAQGGMGSIYRGFDKTLSRAVALKVLHPVFLHDAEFAERFRREAEIWGRLEHPRIIPVYFADIENEVPFLAMKLVAGGTLADLIGRGALPLERAAPILADVAAALDYAHSLGIVHRDVKPTNVLLGEDSRAYLSDFGIAWVVAADNPVSQSGGVFGTPGYMAPEQARSQQPDYRADIYSLGCMAYEMLTGAQPFRGVTPVDVLMRHITESPAPPRDLAPGMPLHVENAILKAMAKDPSQRWPTAAFFVQALLGQVDMEGVQTVSIPGHGTPPSPPSAAPAAPAPPERDFLVPRRTLVLATLLVITLGVFVYLNLERVPPSAGTSSPSPSLGRSADALVSGAQRALDQGAYAEALEMADLALRIDPKDSATRLLRERIERAWDAERSLGLWEAPSPSPTP
jgi:serine/threonine protein kinase